MIQITTHDVKMLKVELVRLQLKPRVLIRAICEWKSGNPTLLLSIRDPLGDRETMVEFEDCLPSNLIPHVTVDSKLLVALKEEEDPFGDLVSIIIARTASLRLVGQPSNDAAVEFFLTLDTFETVATLERERAELCFILPKDV